jgi:hypothetical protein
MGACLDPPNRAIITELAENGSLWDALRLPLQPPYMACDGASRGGWPLTLYQPDFRHGAPPTARLPPATNRDQTRDGVEGATLDDFGDFDSAQDTIGAAQPTAPTIVAAGSQMSAAPEENDFGDFCSAVDAPSSNQAPTSGLYSQTEDPALLKNQRMMQSVFAAFVPPSETLDMEEKNDLGENLSVQDLLVRPGCVSPVEVHIRLLTLSRFYPILRTPSKATLS